MRTICVIGGNGLLGSKILLEATGAYRLISVDLHETSAFRHDGLEYIQGDITDREGVREVIARVHPDCVIHTAAFTDVDGCEREKEKAWGVNVTGAENVALACKAFNAKMIHLSSDYVFDGKEGPYGEEDEVNPISFYGETKLESERIVRDILADFVIARTMVLYGYSPGVRMNFVTWLIDRFHDGKKVRVVADQYGTPTLADDLARALLVLFDRNGRGVYHAVGRESINRYDFALRIAEVFHLDSSLIVRATSDSLHQSAPRPLRSGLKTDKICREMGVAFSSVTDGLLVMRDQMEKAGVYTQKP